MTDQTAQNFWERRELSEKYPVVGSQIERVGVWRALVGGGSMFFAVPMFTVLHLIGYEFLMEGVVARVLGLPRLPARNYIVLDRHKIEGLAAFDKLNCVFCGWANGLSMLMHAELERLNGYDRPLSPPKKAVLYLASALALPVLFLLEEFAVQVIYNLLVSRPLGMWRLSIGDAQRQVEESKFASAMSLIPRLAVRYQKNLDLRLDNALEQIESSWCPFKHFDNSDQVVYPAHHAKFFGPHQIDEMRKVLKTAGTVSDRRPYR